MLGEMFGLVRGCMSCSTAQAELPEHALPQKAFVVGHAPTGLPAMNGLMQVPSALSLLMPPQPRSKVVNTAQDSTPIKNCHCRVS